MNSLEKRIKLLESKVEYLLMIIWECEATVDTAKDIEERLDWEENDIEG